MTEPMGPDPLQDPGRPDDDTADDLDEDALGSDPLEDAMDPPEHWSHVTRTRHDDVGDDEEGLDERLAEEAPDIQP